MLVALPRPREAFRAVHEVTSLRPWNRHDREPPLLADGPIIGVPSRPSTAGELIAWFLANGYTLEQIRVMFPGLFLCASIRLTFN